MTYDPSATHTPLDLDAIEARLGRFAFTTDSIEHAAFDLAAIASRLGCYAMAIDSIEHAALDLAAIASRLLARVRELERERALHIWAATVDSATTTG